MQIPDLQKVGRMVGAVAYTNPSVNVRTTHKGRTKGLREKGRF